MNYQNILKSSVCCFFWLLASAPYANETVTTGDLYPPYVDRSLPDGGLMIPVIAGILDNTEDYFDFEVIFQPWARGYEQTKTGIHLGTFPYVWDTERDQHFYYSQPIFNIGSYLFVRDEVKETEWSLELLKKKGWNRICRPNGYSLEELREPLLSLMEFEVVTPSDLPDCFRLLAQGRVDIVPIERMTGEYTLFQHFIDLKIKMLENSIMDAGLHFIVSKSRSDGKEIIRQFDEALLKAKNSGQLKRWEQDFFDKLALESQ